jgi:ribonuclease J
MVKEEDLEGDLAKIIREYPGLKLVAASPQNVDRMVTLYRAAIKSNGLLVVDLYAAHLLDQIHSYSKTPYPSLSFKQLKVFFSKRMMTHLYRNNRKDIVRRYSAYEISSDQIKANLGRCIFLFRESLLDDVKKLGDLNRSVLIYSMWKGFMDEPKFQTVKRFLDEQGIPIRVLHTSGHASFEDLKRFAQALKPKMVIPIHTTRPNRFKEMHPNIKILSDGEPYQIP